METVITTCGPLNNKTKEKYKNKEAQDDKRRGRQRRTRRKEGKKIEGH